MGESANSKTDRIRMPLKTIRRARSQYVVHLRVWFEMTDELHTHRSRQRDRESVCPRTVPEDTAAASLLCARYRSVARIICHGDISRLRITPPWPLAPPAEQSYENHQLCMHFPVQAQMRAVKTSERSELQFPFPYHFLLSRSHLCSRLLCQRT